jgi:hypothetical protein
MHAVSGVSGNKGVQGGKVASACRRPRAQVFSMCVRKSYGYSMRFDAAACDVAHHRAVRMTGNSSFKIHARF